MAPGNRASSSFLFILRIPFNFREQLTDKVFQFFLDKDIKVKYSIAMKPLISKLSSGRRRQRQAYYRIHRKRILKQCHLRYKKHTDHILRQSRLHYQVHKVQVAKKHRQYRESHKKQLRLWFQKNYAKHKEARKAYQRKYEKLHPRKLTVQRRIAQRLRTRLWMALKGRPKVKSTIQFLGCSIDELKRYLSARFLPSMTWKNYGKWDIDHIQPFDFFDLSKLEELEICCHYTNLQPLWHLDNLRKGVH